MMKNFTFNKSSLIIALILLVVPNLGSAQTYATIPYSTGFESGALDASWTATSSQAGPNIEVVQSGTLTWSTQTAYSHTGNYFLGMDYETGGAYNLNQADLHLNTLGSTNLHLQFWWAEWNDETEAQDGIYISDNAGATYTKILDLNGTSYTDLTWTYFNLDLDSVNAVHGLSHSSTYIIRFQQYDNYYFAGGNDGFLFDDIEVSIPCTPTTSNINPIVCSSYTVPSGDETYTVSGNYTDTIPNATGCDSIISIDLVILSTSNTINPMVCSSYTVPSGDETYTVSGNYTDTIPNTAGCDSIISIDLVILSSSSAINPVACGSYTVPSGDETYTVSGNYMDTIPNSAGCDSIISINLVVNSPSAFTITETTCDVYLSNGGNTYSATGVYTETYTNAAGCDSVVTLDLTINSSTSSTLNESAIGSYTAPSGAVYTSSGTYMDTILNAAGCDSVITINLTIGFTGNTENTIELIELYPNPTNGPLNIQGLQNIEGIQTVLIYDVNGRIVLNLDKTATNFSVSHLDAGMYYLVVQHKTGTTRLPIIKQ